MKVFGAALDVLDDPGRVGLKRAYINAKLSGLPVNDLPLDPYEAISPLLLDKSSKLVPAGAFQLPDWLTPRPQSTDEKLVTSERYRQFIDSGEISKYVSDLAEMVERDIFPDLPVMLAVDHAMSAGPIRALSKLHGPEKLAVLIIDSHFDAIPSHLRAPPGSEAPVCGLENCGSFLAALIEEKVVVPENLFVVGVNDYPVGEVSEDYRKAYSGFLDKGVTVIPRSAGPDAITDQFVKGLEACNGNELYVSLDADAGSLTCMNAVRFLEFEGMSESTIINIAVEVRSLIESGKFKLAGADVTEVDVHMLGLDEADRTIEVCALFLTNILGI